ncbi:T9SS type A sorting domain-containing protein [Lutibacter sp.]|uniref:T9SS type A sorting domain-containing protein n=1 Tax=Lutibacter sp. TaxID=1925666 RepID=UPI0025BB81EA|nr:T9SS type A sorting domain-containing protein [Lutibacter sp.]MCF6181268.1 T9SS type A sorting domain-containing protein [Lutibacter sp.]
MKTKLFFIALIISSFGYSQTFDNIPMGTGIYINKLIASPSGPDLTNEYIEIRGTANAVVPSDLYFISIEGDGSSSSRGKVSEAIKLGDGTRTFGANGILAIVCNYTDKNTNVVTTNAYSSLISSDATVIVIELTGNDVTGSSSSNVSTKTPDIGYDGNLIDATATYMLISASSNPKSVRIDGTSDATDADGIINATGDHTSWTLYDSITYMDDDYENGAEYGYGQIVYAQPIVGGGSRFITTSATIVEFATTSDANYILRQGTKTGYTADDWIVSANGSNSSVPNWVFSTTSTKVYPDAFAGWEGIKDVYGALNPTAAALYVEDNVLASKFNIYPNPAKGFINIKSKNIDITSVKVYNLLGSKILEKKVLRSNKLDISSLSKGIYILNVKANNSNFTKKIIVE